MGAPGIVVCFAISSCRVARPTEGHGGDDGDRGRLPDDRQLALSYVTSLAANDGSATQSYAFGHPSLPNYLDIVSGSNESVTDDNPPSAHSFPAVPTWLIIW